LDYRSPDHPLQLQVREALTGFCGEDLDLAVDGCGVPTFGLSVLGMARAWSRLAEAMDDGPGSSLGRIGRVMARHPNLTSGTDRLDAAVVALARETLAVKIGAAGLFCMALPDRRLGIAVKVHSGDRQALGCAVLATLAKVAPGAIAQPPEDWPWHVVRNVIGVTVGRRYTRI
jgi:L-asparaginase II